MFPPVLNSLIIRNGSTTPFIASSIKSFVPFGRVSRRIAARRIEIRIHDPASRLATNAAHPGGVTHGPTCQVRPHTRRNLASHVDSTEFAECLYHTGLVCAAIFPLRARFFFFLSLFFFYAATNTCFEAGHAFSKAIRLASATMLYESTCVERGNGERETDAAGR